MSSTITSDRISHTYGYAWLGTAGKSASTLTRDGVEIRRNLCTNPGFEVDTSGWSTSGTSATTYAWTGSAGASTSVQRVNGTVRRTNRATVPSALSTTNPSAGGAGWNPRWFGGSANQGTNTVVSGAYDGPVAGLTSYARKTWTQISGVAYDCAWSHTAGGTSALAVTPGALISISSYIRPSRSQSSSGTGYTNTRMAVQWLDSTGTQLSTALGPTPDAMVAGQWTRFTYSGTVPAGAAYLSVFTQVYLDLWQVGDTLDGTGLLIENAVLGAYFDGDTPGATQGLDVFQTPLASHSGLASMQVRWRNQVGSPMYAATQVGGLVPDTDYTASLWVSIPRRLSKPLTVSVVTNGYDLVGPNPITLQEATVGWQRIVMPFRTATGRTSADIWLVDPNSYTGGTVSQSIYIDDVLVETGGTTLPYFDGSTLGYVEFENTRPLLVNGWEEEADSLNVVNAVIGGGFDVTLRDASLRKGAFELVYPVDDEAAAAAAFAMHRRPTTLTISDSDRPSIAMTYVVNGRISRTLDPDRMYWLIRVEYQEV
ncbi:hypothetical protein [Curtobacterium sp. MCBA15_004]|uniref:hypothetical protein n=1 Tax=Curtobacterium sp. MCBA15_004 TaxID=1898733 RepID=UPI0008DCC870|nr:hypothetical protein [Curtobacterium sp. MCBA15_004]WIA98027.1 hypothetical protein QOL16_06470 [Curtobacterium sp. MCBA15_004]